MEREISAPKNLFIPLTKRELCQLLNIEESTLIRLDLKGLPRFRLGMEVRYYYFDVLNFLRDKGELEYVRRINKPKPQEKNKKKKQEEYSQQILELRKSFNQRHKKMFALPEEVL